MYSLMMVNIPTSAILTSKYTDIKDPYYLYAFMRLIEGGGNDVISKVADATATDSLVC